MSDLRRAAQDALLFIESLPMDLGKGSLNGYRVQVPHSLRAALSEAPAQEMTDDLRRMLGELFGIGSAARDNATILANAENAARRARCLSAVEREFFTDLVPDEDNQDGPPSEECRLPWGAEPDEYVAAMRADRASRLPAVTECNDNDSPWLVCKTCAAHGLCAKSLPEMGEGDWPNAPAPRWYAVDTPGADYDTSFVSNRGDAEHLVWYDDNDTPTPIVELFDADQLRTAMAAAVEAYKAMLRGETT